MQNMHNEEEMASTTLKVLLLVLAIVLVGALGYLVWKQNNSTDTTDSGTVTTRKVTPTVTTTATTTVTATATARTTATVSATTTATPNATATARARATATAAAQ